MQVTQIGPHVFIASGERYDASCWVTDSLQLLDLALRHVVVQRGTVVQLTGDESMDKLFCWLPAEIFPYYADVVKMVRCRFHTEAMCWFMVRCLSNRTPRPLTMSLGDADEAPIWTVGGGTPKASVLEEIRMTSVFASFILRNIFAIHDRIAWMHCWTCTTLVCKTAGSKER